MKVLILLALVAFSYQQTTPIDVFGNGVYKFSYSTGTDNTITMTMDVAATGWVGVGISPNGVMDGSDVVLCYIDANNSPVCQDSKANGYSILSDVQQGGKNDVTNLKGAVANGRTTISFTKPLNTGDKYDVPITQGTNHFVVFAYLLSGNAANGFMQHTNKVMKQMVLYPAAVATPPATGSSTGSGSSTTGSTGTTTGTTGTTTGTTGTTTPATSGPTSTGTTGTTTGTTGTATGTSGATTGTTGTTTGTTGTTGTTTTGATNGTTGSTSTPTTPTSTTSGTSIQTGKNSGNLISINSTLLLLLSLIMFA
jgi:hypothetical protein